VNYYDLYEGSEEYAHGLDDAGGWAQLKARPATRLEINAGFGVDNPFAKEIQAAMASAGSSNYPGLARNRGVYSNAIYSPSAYLLFSVEYRRLWTNYSSGPTDFTDVIGIGAGTGSDARSDSKTFFLVAASSQSVVVLRRADTVSAWKSH